MPEHGPGASSHSHTAAAGLVASQGFSVHSKVAVPGARTHQPLWPGKFEDSLLEAACIGMWAEILMCNLHICVRCCPVHLYARGKPSPQRQPPHHARELP